VFDPSVSLLVRKDLMSARRPAKGITVTITSLHTKSIITQPTAYYDDSASAVMITEVTITDPSVVAEAMHWSSGQRGGMCDPGGLAGVDLSPFVRQALNIGVQAIALAGGAQDKFELKQLINDIGERTSRAAADAAHTTATVVDEATLAIRRAATDASLAFGEAGKLARGEFADSVKTAQTGLQDELRRLFGGDDPELHRRLDVILEGFDYRVNRQRREDRGTLCEGCAAVRPGRAHLPDGQVRPAAGEAPDRPEGEHGSEAG
jgi:hypothetical protein